MKTSKRLNKEGIMVSSDVFAAYYNDGCGDEWVYFKLLAWEESLRMVHALREMHAIGKYTIDRHEEAWRNGFINTKLRLHIHDRVHMCFADVKRIICELLFAMGYNLHWIPVTNLLNLKIEY